MAGIEESLRATDKLKLNNNYIEELEQYCELSKAEEIMFDSVMKTAFLAMKTSLTINAGAATAFLSFIGYLLSRDVIEISFNSMSLILLFFSLGALSATLATGLAYLTQGSYYKALANHNSNNKKANTLKFITIILVIVSYGLFGAGIVKSYCVFSQVDTKISQNKVNTK
jgi:hypothetical protein